MKTHQILSSLITPPKKKSLAFHLPSDGDDSTDVKFFESSASMEEVASPGDEPDTLLIGKGNVAYRMADLINRRQSAALSGQQRETQRYDKKIMLLRAAMGLPKMPPEEVVRTHTTSKDPTNNDNLVVASIESDADWMKRTTVKNLAATYKTLHDRGYEYTFKVEGHLTNHTWKGFRGKNSDTLKIVTIGRNWATAAFHNDKRLDCFTFNSEAGDDVEKGIPVELASETWDGNINPNNKQKYVASWVQIRKITQ